MGNIPCVQPNETGVSDAKNNNSRSRYFFESEAQDSSMVDSQGRFISITRPRKELTASMIASFSGNAADDPNLAGSAGRHEFGPGILEEGNDREIELTITSEIQDIPLNT